MLFQTILGQNFIKKHLTTSVDRKRVAHAQLFVGTSGSGVLPCAIAYAQYLICSNTEGENTGGSTSCNLKFDHLAHPDLHFAYPVATTDSIKSHPVSDNFAKEWRSFIKQNPYGSLYDWHQHIGIDKKQGKIGVDEAHDIVKKLSLKSYEGGFKVMIIWMADKMNSAASNKLLKLIEEPPQKTVFILIAENEDLILDTIKSRCQILKFPPLAAEALETALINEHNCNASEAKKLAIKAHGDYNLAMHLLDHSSDEEEFETWFVSWVRTAFKARGNKKSIIDLISWSESIASKGRETQKNFLGYCEDFFRQAMLLNYGATNLVYLQPVTQFELAKFAPFIHGNNIESLIEELQTAAYHIERNGNAKIILTDLSIKLTRLLHTKA
ncbi:ATP-binding protein [Leeuwenhoekiella marinoflava]|uniref:DNA polymerase-3 subunit delta n=2 Tax=Leeuwenhoekiella marinoflava TaxID=988 RepID=A0A4V1KSU6_9FLAO|nr:DNA polymerase III subunit delta' [Leeuwenhoekiella marinoflava]RXG32968.1 DNA polymerase-3 subunit delta' [Leeuwenhoekiella marinoflava]SHE33775.1 DNA polymerase-3 subunit delta' [Leeuwenhoekiella marinoflava DSM 3653]